MRSSSSSSWRTSSWCRSAGWRSRWRRKCCAVPRNILMPTILLFCIVGAFAINNSVFGVVLILAFGADRVLHGRERLPDRAGDPRRRARHDDGGELHHLDDQVQRRSDRVLHSGRSRCGSAMRRSSSCCGQSQPGCSLATSAGMRVKTGVAHEKNRLRCRARPARCHRRLCHRGRRGRHREGLVHGLGDVAQRAARRRRR